MRAPITSKSQMYALLSAGRLGNTIRQFFDLDEWEASADSRLHEVWGVRTLTPGGPCRLFCPRDEVRPTAASFAPHPVNVSVMIDAVVGVLLMAEVCRAPWGLSVYGIDRPPRGANWRRDVPRLARTYEGLSALQVLRRNLGACSLADLDELLDAYPDHVVELSACDRDFGTIPGRNAVVWECRAMDGSYEKSWWS